jgi:subtilisin family serine protease
MQIFVRYGLVLMLLSAQPSSAQIRLPQLPVGLPTQALHNTTQLLNQTESQTLHHLSNLRLLEVTRLARTYPTKLELDPDGQLMVRSEILALTPTETAVEKARAAGFSIVREQNLDSLGLHVIVLGIPGKLATKKALRQLREADPAGTYDYNHIYLGSGSGSGSASFRDAQRATVSDTAANKAANDASPTSKIRVGLVDSGVDGSHPAFAAAAIAHWGCDDKLIPAAHGTAVASLLVGGAEMFHGVQPQAALYAADVYCGAPTGGALDAMLGAFGWLAQAQVPVINVSLVGPKNAMLQAVIAKLIAAGFTIVAAVGNDGPAAPPLYPASYPNVIGVTAVDAHRHVLIEAARGPQVMFAAVGADTAAAGTNKGYAAVRGTSFAAPIVAALLAAQVTVPDPAQVTVALSALERQAIDLGPSGRDLTYGFGLVGEEFRNDPAALKNR